MSVRLWNISFKNMWVYKFFSPSYTLKSTDVFSLLRELTAWRPSPPYFSMEGVDGGWTDGTWLLGVVVKSFGKTSRAIEKPIQKVQFLSRLVFFSIIFWFFLCMLKITCSHEFCLLLLSTYIATQKCPVPKARKSHLSKHSSASWHNMFVHPNSSAIQNEREKKQRPFFVPRCCPAGAQKAAFLDAKVSSTSQ